MKTLTEQEKQRIKNDDMAFINSILSYSIYTEKEWISSLADSREVIGEKLEKSLPTMPTSQEEQLQNSYENYLYAYVRNNFKPINITEDKTGIYKSEDFNYQTDYKFGSSDYIASKNLARASYFVTQNSDGTNTLHLSFRGTDKKARGMLSFVEDAYLDMTAYYDAFKPLEEAIIKYAKDPKNKIAEVHVSGHSLGGAMVQEFFKSPKVQESGLSCRGFTFGAPGTNKKEFYEALVDIYHSIRKRNLRAFTDLAQNIMPNIFGNFMPSGPSDMSTKKVANHIFKVATGFSLNIEENTPKQTLERQDEKYSFNNNSKIQQYKHLGDLIPILGSAVYKESGNSIRLRDYVNKVKLEDNFLTDNKNTEGLWAKAKTTYKKIVKNVFSFKYHDMMRYLINIETKINQQIEKNGDLKELTPYFNEFMRNKAVFMEHEKQHPTVIYELSQANYENNKAKMPPLRTDIRGPFKPYTVSLTKTETNKAQLDDTSVEKPKSLEKSVDTNSNINIDSTQPKDVTIIKKFSINSALENRNKMLNKISEENTNNQANKFRI